jgi:hypothetical protein
MKINGKRVVDATRPLTIEVTARDAAAGKRNDPGGCAAARAIMRGYRDSGVSQARVHLGRTYIEYEDKWVRYNTPAALKTEITSFDRGAEASYAAGTYNLAPIQPSNRFGVKRSGPSGRRGKRPHIVRIRHQIEGVRARGANR